MSTPLSAAQPPTVVGVDLVEVARLRGVMHRRAAFAPRVFTATELADARRGGVAPGSEVEAARLAARFAAKEAVRKALRAPRLPFHAVEVRTAPDGAPRLWVRGAPSPLALSLAHDGGLAIAFVAGPAGGT